MQILKQYQVDLKEKKTKQVFGIVRSFEKKTITMEYYSVS